jgi:hypothetical protein
MRRVPLLIAAAMMLGLPVQAKIPFLKKAQDLGYADAKNCQYCHVDKMPKKGASEGNERGKFLIATKAKKGAAEVDVSWLKDYKGK